jgi:hypothetical protein
MEVKSGSGHYADLLGSRVPRRCRVDGQVCNRIVEIINVLADDIVDSKDPDTELERSRIMVNEHLSYCRNGAGKLLYCYGVGFIPCKDLGSNQPV